MIARSQSVLRLRKRFLERQTATKRSKARPEAQPEAQPNAQPAVHQTGAPGGCGNGVLNLPAIFIGSA
ncbi:hypothetical protein [Paraburkholderia sp.]|uniref:hypothetical protein n=1 Tax=Paraburkholderia sp. TaxID=1926495 RepID=UPI0025D54CEA|nr:hypothetical protein [Paraburkholderia sp.]